LLGSRTGSVPCKCWGIGVLWKWRCGYIANLILGGGLCPLHAGCLEGSEAVKCSCDAVSDLSEYLCGSCGHNGVTDYRIENVTKKKCHYCGEFQ
jgi:hypothetical protein